MRSSTTRPARAGFALLLLASFLFAACGSTKEKKPEYDPKDGRVAALDEVPTHYRDAWEAWLAGGEKWKAARPAAVADPELRQALVDNWIIVMGHFYSGRALAARGQMPGPFLRAQRELVLLGMQSAPSLVEFVRAGDEVAATLAADTLEQMQDPRVCALVTPLLADDDAQVRRRAANLLARLPNAQGDEDAVLDALGAAAQDDAEWMVRAQAVRALGERGARASRTEPFRQTLVRALQDTDPAVREAACRALAKVGDPMAIPALISHLGQQLRGDGRPAGVRAAQVALQQLSGRRESWNPIEWERWWRSEGLESATRGRTGAAQ